MERFYRPIDPQEKVPYESQIALWAYLALTGRSRRFEDFVMSEALIKRFNADIRREDVRRQLDGILRREAATVDRLLQAFQTEPWTVVKPVVWNANAGNCYFIENLTLSHRFEIYIDCVFKVRGLDIGLYYGRELQYSGENAAGIEIKRDMMAVKTGNLYIEYAERHYAAGSWIASGILKDDNTRFFLLGDVGKYYILRKSDLLGLYEALTGTPPRPVPPGVRKAEAKRGTSLGFLLPARLAEGMAPPLAELAQHCKKIPDRPSSDQRP